MGRKLTNSVIQDRTDKVSNGRLEFVGWQSEEETGKDALGVFRHECGTVFHRLVGNVIHNKVVSCPTCNPASFPRDREKAEKQLGENGYKLISPVTPGKYGDRYFVIVEYPCGEGCTGRHTMGSLVSNKNRPQCPVHTEGYGAQRSRESIEEQLRTLPYGSFTITGTFVNSSKPMTLKCRGCDGEFEIKNLSSIIQREGKCTLCGSTVKSVREEFVAICLHDLGVKFTREYFLEGRWYDFLLTDLNIIIEYDGDQHRTGRWLGNPIRNADREKDDIAKRNGFEVHRISGSDSVVKKILEILEGSTTIRKE